MSQSLYQPQQYDSNTLPQDYAIYAVTPPVSDFCQAGFVPLSSVPLTPFTSDSIIYSPSAVSTSGSSAQASDDDHSDYILTDQYCAQPPQQQSPFPNYQSLLEAPPVYSIVNQIEYGPNRVLFIEKLIWNCVGQIYSIWGSPTRREPGGSASIPLQQLVHEGLIHGLCNEIVILPVMENIQNAQTGCHSADLIPFPLFMVEMLRRMRISCFLLQVAMRYIIDIATQVQLAKERSRCGWCLSGIAGCSHAAESSGGPPTSRFARGRSSAASKKSIANPPSMPSSAFTKVDPLGALVDPRKAFLGSLVIANKFHRDRSLGNKAWATLIGLPVEEVHCSERAVGEALGWSLSRPWIKPDELDANGNPTPGSVHPSFSEPLFATNDTEVEKYGVKSLRETGRIPPPQSRDQIFTTEERSFFDCPITLDPDSLLAGPQLRSNLAASTTQQQPKRSRSLLTELEHRKIAPLPSKPSAMKLKANPLRKACTAPGVLEPSCIYGQTPAGDMRLASPSVGSVFGSFNAEVPIPMSVSPLPLSTPTAPVWQTIGKRKASEDLGRKVLARCGENGQRILVAATTTTIVSPGQSSCDSGLPSPITSYASSRGSPTPEQTKLAFSQQAMDAVNMPLWHNSNQDEDSKSVPELDADDIDLDCNSTPTSGGGLSRTNTPPDLMEIAAQIAIAPTSSSLWQSGRTFHIPSWEVAAATPTMNHGKSNILASRVSALGLS